MCGLARELRFDQSFANVGAVVQMNAVQSDRGPGGEGIFSMGGTLLRPSALAHHGLESTRPSAVH